MLIERSYDAWKLWRAMMPHSAAPEMRQFVLWANRFTDAQIERALMRTSRRFPSSIVEQNPDAAQIHKFVTGLLLNLERQDRQTSTSTNQPLSSIADKL